MSVAPCPQAEGLLDLPYVQLSGAIMAGGTSAEMFDRLSSHFPAISRGDAFLGFCIAWTQLSADLLIAEAENRLLRSRIAEGRVAA